MSREKQSIQVTIRLRPISQKDYLDDSRVCVKVQHQTHSIIMTNDNKKFTFDEVCQNDTQEDMFLKVGKKSTHDCLEGYNCTVFAYGQTGAGKTFTMMGVNFENENSFELRGLIPRTLEYLFQCIDEDMFKNRTQYLIRCSFLEIYNQQIIDLLNKANVNLQLREDIKKGVYVEGVEQQIITRPDQAMEILKKGSKGRHVGSTCYNQASSRSHSVFTMLIQSKQSKNNGVINTKSRHFHFIDLAGSERTKQSIGERLKQGCSINKSLHVLGKVINSLADYSEGKTKHINYRDSKLTFLLKDSLGGNSKTHLIANIHIGMQAYHQTISTLSFARRVKLIKLNKVSINEDSSGNIQALKGQIKRLKDQIIRMREAPLPLRNPQIDTVNNTQNHQKITTILHQYVSEQLQKQTKFQFQISKLQTRIMHLQQGIKHYAQNQANLRMIISVYQDKILRNKKMEEQLKNKLETISQEQSKNMMEYLKQDRQNLIKQINLLKSINKNNGGVVNLIKSALTQGKVEGEDDEMLIDTISRNNELLSDIKKYISQHLNNETNPQNYMLTERQKQNQISILQLSEKNQQLTLQLAEIKQQNQENQILLGESVDTQINLQKEIQNLKGINQSYEQLKVQLTNQCQKYQIQLKQQESLYSQKLQKLISQIQSLNIEKFSFQQKIRKFQSQIVSIQKQTTSKINDLQQIIKEKESQNNHLKKQIINSSQQLVVISQKLSHLQVKQIEDNKLYLQTATKFNQQKKYLQNQIYNIKQQLENQIEKYKNKQNELKEIIKKQAIFKQQSIIQINEKQLIISQLRGNIENLTRQLSQQKKQLNLKLLQIQQIKKQRDQKFQQSNLLQQKITILQNQLLKQKQKIIQKQQQIVKINNQFLSKNQLINQLDKKNNFLNQQVTRIQNQLIFNSQKVITLQKDFLTKKNQLMSKIMNIQINATTFKQKLVVAELKLQKNKQQLTQTIQLLNIQKQTLLKKLQEMKQINLQLQYKFNEQQKNHISNKKEIQKYKLQIIQNINKLENYKKINGQLKFQYKQKQKVFRQKLEKMQKNQNKLNEQIKNYNDQIKNNQIKQYNYKKQIQNYQLKAIQMDQIINVKQQQLNKANCQLLNFKKQFNSYQQKSEKQSQQYKRKIIDLQGEVNAQKLKLKKLIEKKGEQQNQAYKIKQQLIKIKFDLQKQKQLKQKIFQQNNKNKYIVIQLNIKVQNYQQIIGENNDIIMQKQKKMFQIKNNNFQIEKTNTKLQNQILKMIQKQKQKDIYYLQIISNLKEKIQESQKKQEKHQKIILQLEKKVIQNQISVQSQNKISFSNLKQKQNENINLKSQIHQMNAQIINLKYKIQKTQKQSFEKKKLNQKLQQTLKYQKQLVQEQLRQVKKTFQTQIQNVRSTLIQVKNSLKKQISIKQTVIKQNNMKTSIISNLQQRIIQLTKTITQQKSKMNQKQEQIFKLIKNHEKLKQTLSIELNNAQNQIISIKQQILLTQNKLQQSNLNSNKFINLLKTQKQQLNINFKKINQQNLNLNIQIQQNKQIISNFKILISNSESQRQQLQIQLEEKDNIYKKLVEKIVNNEDKYISNNSNEHYLKTVELLEKSRQDLIETKKINQQQKKAFKKLKQQIQEKQDQVISITAKAQEYCKKQQIQIQQIQNDYLRLQTEYQNLLKQKTIYEETKIKLQSIQQEIKAYKIASSRSSIKIEELQDRNKLIEQQKSQLLKQYQEIKKQVLRNGNTNEQSKMKYINQLKEQKTILKRQNQILTQQLARQNEEKNKLKSQKRYSGICNNNEISNFKIELEKRNSQIKYLQEIVAEALNMLGVKRVDPKYKSESIRSNLIVGLKDLLNELQVNRDKVKDLSRQIQDKNLQLQLTNKQFTSYKNRHSNLKDLSLPTNNHSINTNDNNILSSVIRNKIMKVQSSFNSIKQSIQQKQNQVNPLKSKDVNGSYTTLKRFY